MLFLVMCNTLRTLEGLPFLYENEKHLRLIVCLNSVYSELSLQ